MSSSVVLLSLLLLLLSAQPGLCAFVPLHDATTARKQPNVVGHRPSFPAAAVEGERQQQRRRSHDDVAVVCGGLTGPLYATKTTVPTKGRETVVAGLIQDIDALLADPTTSENGTGKGMSKLHNLLRELESYNTQMEPNRSPDFLGEWHVWYTDCPPPSNGQLGPFQGTARQVIQDATTHSYQNLLSVPPNDWLTATLDGVWEEWDGQLLVNDINSINKDDSSTATKRTATTTTTTPVDWGAQHWKVTFVQLTVSCLGIPVPFLSRPFAAGTCRVWRTTYMDDTVRIVRAGKTGRVADEVVFYTKRVAPPPGLLR